MTPRNRLSIVLTLLTVLFCISSAYARLTQFVVDKTKSESPTFGGYSWPGVGQYQKIVGMATCEIDPNDPKNAVITDIALAPRNAHGNVEFSFTFYLLKPIDLSKGAHKAMYEPPNRGNKLWGTLGRFPGGNDPGSVTDATTLANSFLMPRGYTIVWNGWDKAAGTNPANFNSIIHLPVATNQGATIMGPAFEYIVMGSAVPSYTLKLPGGDLGSVAGHAHPPRAP